MTQTLILVLKMSPNEYSREQNDFSSEENNLILMNIIAKPTELT